MRFGAYTLDRTHRRLVVDGGPVQLGARAFDLLLALVDARDRVVAKDELIRRVWPGTLVDENNLTVHISALRKALHDGSAEQRVIRTVPGRGYRFVANLAELPASPPAVLRPHAVPPKPSILVLPFTDMTRDAGQEHLADGITEDIIAELSRNRWLTVIARNTAFTLKGTTRAIPELAALFDVHYVLEGSMSRSAGRLRCRVQLIDAQSGEHLVAERYDRPICEVFELQDAITAAITTLVRPALAEAEQARAIRRHPDSVDAWAAYQRGMWLFSRIGNGTAAEAAAWFRRATAIDPNYAPGHYGLALTLLHDGSAFIPGAPPDWQAQGEALVQKSIALDPRDAAAHGLLGLARMVRGDHEGALAVCDAALLLNPSDATVHGARGAALVFTGRPREGLEALATSLRLSPRDPRLHIRLAHVGLGHYFNDDLQAAETAAHQICREFPDYSFGPRLLAMVHAERGRPPEARAALDRARTISPDHFTDFRHARMPWYRETDHRRVVRALLRAGLDPAAVG